MKTKAAILWGLNEEWSVEDVELDDPKEGEALIRLVASGLCHTDEHLVTGDIPFPFPVVGGHEGAGVVEKVGPGVTGLDVGDHVVLAFIPSCGSCRYCNAGRTNLCELGTAIVLGPQLDGTYRFHARGEDVGQMFVLGTFSQHTVVHQNSIVKIDKDIPLDKAALVGCGVTTGFGCVVSPDAGAVRPGDVVVVIGCGGVGSNAIQGARLAGARAIVAVDPVAMKRDFAKQFGATHVAEDADKAWNVVSELTRGQLADTVVLATSVAEPEQIGQALALAGRGGKVVVTSVGHPDDTQVDMSLFELVMFEKRVMGSLYGSCNPRTTIPQILEHYRNGQLMLDELVTPTRYELEDINQGYQDMRDGKNIRGVITYD